MKSHLALFGFALLSACGGDGGGVASPGPTSAVALEIINGKAVPPAPASGANDATVAGIDVNSNGVRDDVERKLAADYGANLQGYDQAFAVAKTLQAAISTPTKPVSDAHIAVLLCLSPEMLTQTDSITKATLNTGARRDAYAEVFAGSSIEECAK